MGITVAVQLEHLVLPKILTSTTSGLSGLILVPNVETHDTVKDTVKSFIRRNFFIGDELQVLQGPLFRKLDEKENVEDLYKRYSCHAEIETSDIHVDEDSYTFFAREGGRTVELEDNQRLECYHILDKTVLQLRRLPRPLPDDGGRIFVETKDGILPLLAVTSHTQVLELKHALERMTGIPVDKQLLSSVGRIMHDEFHMKDFDGVHRVCEDSILDLCKSGDSNIEQGHKRMVVSINVMGEQTFTMVVQGRDLVQSVLQVVEARMGVAAWQQRITFSGKILQEKKKLGDYHIHPDCTLQVTIFKSPRKLSKNVVDITYSSGENPVLDENKPAARKIKLLRTSKGRINGSITIPVLTRDTVTDLRRKVRRTLQPLTERNFVVKHGPATESNNSSSGTKLGPSPSSRESEAGSGRRLSRMLSFTGKSFTGQSTATSPRTSANVSTSQSPESAVKANGSSSKALAARMVSLKNFSGPLLSTPPTKLDQQRQTGTSASRLDGNLYDSSEKRGQGGNDYSKPVAARVLQFQNFSGPLVLDPPNKGIPPPSAPLIPPPLISPRATPSVTRPFGSNAANIAPLENPLPDVKAPRKRAGENEQPSLAGTPLKFVHVRQVSNATNGGPGLSRNTSIGSAHFSPTELHSLPEPAELFSAREATSTPPESSPKSQISTSSKKVNASTPIPEKKGLSAWFTDSMQTLKEHIRAPFAER